MWFIFVSCIEIKNCIDEIKMWHRLQRNRIRNTNGRFSGYFSKSGQFVICEWLFGFDPASKRQFDKGFMLFIFFYCCYYFYYVFLWFSPVKTSVMLLKVDIKTISRFSVSSNFSDKLLEICLTKN